MGLTLAVALGGTPELKAEPMPGLRAPAGRPPAAAGLRDPRAEPRFDDLDSPAILARPPAPEAPSALAARASSDADCGMNASVLPISSYDDDPFVAASIVECMDASSFETGADGLPVLSNEWVRVQDGPVIFRQDLTTGEFQPFAHNPWPCCVPPSSNELGDFLFPNEARFPLFERELDADGKPILRDGLEVWSPQNLYYGFTTVFEAANSAREAAEFWAGRELSWGNDNQLRINAHAFVGFNAFYSPAVGGLFFGVVPHRLLGDQEHRVFELATSWEIAVHEAGHALHAALKPNSVPTNQGFRTWGESFSDQLAMWAALRDPERVRALLAETDDLSASNSLTRLAEVFAAFVGEGTGLRDAVHDKTVSTTSEQEHARSEVLTGAAYQFFLTVYEDLARERGPGERALREAGTILGTFLTRAADYTPENTMTLQDVAMAYLKVDEELFDGRYHDVLVDEFVRRELLGAGSVAAWTAHEAAMPKLRLPAQASRGAIKRSVQANLDALGLGPNFGLKLQSVTRDLRSRQTIVRVQLTEGRGAGAVPLDNHGLLTFRANGRLADYHAPLPSAASQEEVLALLDEARQLGLDQHGVPLAIVAKPDGELTVEAHVLGGSGINAHVEAFTLDSPQGERREILEVLR